MAGAPVSHQLRWMENPPRVLPPLLPHARLRSSLSGLVEEDVPRLRVLGDVGGEAVKLLDGLGVDFLHRQNRRLDESKQQQQQQQSVRERRTSTMSSSNSSQKPWLFTMVM